LKIQLYIRRRVFVKLISTVCVLASGFLLVNYQNGTNGYYE
jgi:hypothetical protein